MRRLVPKHFYITFEQDKLLRRHSRELGVSQSAITRRAIDGVIRPAQYLPLDHAAWEEALRFIEGRLAMKVPKTNRRWTRDELHED